MLRLRQAVRPLLRTPFVTLLASISLALGIGANSALFSLFDQMVLRSLPVPAPDQLVILSSVGPKQGSVSCNNTGECDQVFSYPMFKDLEAAESGFAGVAAHRTLGANVTVRGQTESTEGTLVSGGYFSTLGLQPALGRLLGPEDNLTPGAHPVVVLSHDTWRSRFGASPSALGETMTVNGHPLTIVGVAPPGFRGITLGTQSQFFVPMVMREELVPGFRGLGDRRNYWAYAFARLKPGVSAEAAQTAINVPYRALLNEVEAPLQENFSEQTMERFRAKTLRLLPGSRGQSSLRAQIRGPLLLLLGATGFVLLIACANVANLLLARAVSRSGEIAVRLSIGARRGQLIAQLLLESCLLAFVAGLGGILAASLTLKLVAALLPAPNANAISFELDPVVLGATALLALFTGLAFGLFPALHSTRPELVSALKGQSGRGSGTRTAARFRGALVIGQIALAMALLVSAGLFTKSLANVSRVELGLSIDNLVRFAISPELNGYTPDQSRELFERIETELAALPGVTGVTSSMVPLLAGDNWGNNVTVQGFAAEPDTDTNASVNEVGADFFRTLRIPLLAGREFTATDRVGTSKVAIVNEAFAKKFQLGRDVVGRRMAVGGGSGVELDIDIIGLVADAKYSDVKRPVPPQYFTPFRQDEGLGSLTFYVRSATAPEAVMTSLRQTLRRIDPNLPLEYLMTMQQQVEEGVSTDRVISTLSAAFAGLATLLAAVGLYGVLAYSVAQRQREIGLRMALGADAGRVRAMVLRQLAWMTALGGMLGCIGALILGRLGRSLLFELEGHDPGVLLSAAVLLGLIAFASGFVPATRAARVEPMRALRND